MLPLYFLLISAYITVSFSFDATNISVSIPTLDVFTEQSVANDSIYGNEEKAISSSQDSQEDSSEASSSTNSTPEDADYETTVASSNTKKPSKQEMMDSWSLPVRSQQQRSVEDGRYPSETKTPIEDAAEALMPQNAPVEPASANNEEIPLDPTAPSGLRIIPGRIKESSKDGDPNKQDESKRPEMWNVRYIRKDDSEVEHYLVNLNTTWKKAKKFCKKMKMQLTKFEDNDEPGFVLEPLHRKCSHCRTAWINGVIDRRDGYTCKMVHIQGEEAGMIRCSSRNKSTKKRTFLCTKKISPKAKGIKVKAKSSKNKLITQIFFAKPATWKQAYNNCKSKGYRLGVFGSIPELETILNSYLKICSGCGGLYWTSTPPWTSYEKIATEVEEAFNLADRKDFYEMVKKLCKKTSSLTGKKKSPSKKNGKQIAELLRKAYLASNGTSYVGRSNKFCDALQVDEMKLMPLECDKEPDKKRSDSPRGYVCTKL